MITIATTIGPHRISLQQVAISSWVELGAKVICVTTKAEAVHYGPAFPSVTFVCSERNGERLYGKPYIYLDDVLGALKSSESKLCAIINSDIIIRNHSALLANLNLVRDSMLACVRTDIINPNDAVGTLGKWGYDAFFFPSSWLGLYPKTDFCLGLPAWDYWLPLVPILRGHTVRVLREQFFFHVAHDASWQSETPRMLGKLVSYLKSEELGRHFPPSGILREILNYELGVMCLNYLSTSFDLFIRCHSLTTGIRGATGEGEGSASEKEELFANFVKSASFLYKETQQVSRELDRVRGSVLWRLCERPRRFLRKLLESLGMGTARNSSARVANFARAAPARKP